MYDEGLRTFSRAEALPKAIFQSCGPISKARLSSTSTEQSPHVLLYYENRENALNAVTKFNGLPADGQKLVVVLASQNLSIQERVYSAGKNDDILATEQPSGYVLHPYVGFRIS
jgi:RNA recognition motif